MGIGLFIYLYYRDTPLLFEQWLGLEHQVGSRTNELGNWSSFFRYNLPDGLWFYALLSAIILIWGKLPYRNDFFLVFSTVFALPYLLETGQYLKWFSGTFDVIDMLVYSAFGLLAIFLHYKTLTKPSHD
ncbi:MAG: hypothetical protein EP332_08875 [Bacteroidetes bacterium]|nr:MAG: hypothetical protein EP332_08875 [Bacteroidota bacterium]